MQSRQTQETRWIIPAEHKGLLMAAVAAEQEDGPDLSLKIDAISVLWASSSSYFLVSVNRHGEDQSQVKEMRTVAQIHYVLCI